MGRDDDLIGFLIEHFEDYFEMILEGQAALTSVPGDIAQLKDDMLEVKDDVKAIKAALISHSRELSGHGKRLTKLENAAA